MKSIEDYNFNTDIDVGERGEKVISDFLVSHNCKFLNDNKDNKYDLKMLTHKNIPTTIEINTMLSIPNMISKKVSVNREDIASGVKRKSISC